MLRAHLGPRQELIFKQRIGLQGRVGDDFGEVGRHRKTDVVGVRERTRSFMLNHRVPTKANKKGVHPGDPEALAEPSDRVNAESR